MRKMHKLGLFGHVCMLQKLDSQYLGLRSALNINSLSWITSDVVSLYVKRISFIALVNTFKHTPTEMRSSSCYHVTCDTDSDSAQLTAQMIDRRRHAGTHASVGQYVYRPK